MLEITQTTPGRRFQERYRKKKGDSPWKRCLWICAGVVLTLVGVFFLVVPGPGIPILLIGLALLAQTSAAVARGLDRAEVKLRRWWKKVRRR